MVPIAKPQEVEFCRHSVPVSSGNAIDCAPVALDVRVVVFAVPPVKVRIPVLPTVKRVVPDDEAAIISPEFS